LTATIAVGFRFILPIHGWSEMDDFSFAHPLHAA